MPDPTEVEVVTATGVATVNGARLAYDVVRVGTPPVLIHAGIGDRRMWDEQVSAFARHYRVIRYDVRGAGESGMPDGVFAHHADLQGLLRYLGVARAVVLGRNQGSPHGRHPGHRPHAEHGAARRVQPDRPRIPSRP